MLIFLYDAVLVSVTHFVPLYRAEQICDTRVILVLFLYCKYPYLFMLVFK